MKIILLYGPGEVAKRNEALRIKKQFAPEDVSQFDLKGAGVKDLEIQLVSPSLFSVGQRLVVVENTADNFDLQKLNSCGNSLTLLLISGSPKTDSLLLSSAKNLNAKLMVFEGEKELTAFPFLDALIEQKKQAFLELEKLLKEYGGVYVLSMVFYLLRRNILPLPKIKFAADKILKQKAKFETHDLQNFYQFALKAEYGIKSGALDEKNALTILVQKIISWGQH